MLFRSNGFRNDLPGIGEYCRKQGIFFFVDAIQSLGVIPMDVKAYGIDALSADGHKWMLSPEGIGGFYISRDVMEMVEPVVLGWHSVRNRFDFEHYDFRLSPDARRFEPGSFNTVGLASFGASLELILSVGVERIWERVRRLTEEAIEVQQEQIRLKKEIQREIGHLPAHSKAPASRSSRSSSDSIVASTRWKPRSSRLQMLR